MSQVALQDVKRWSLSEWLQLPEGPPFYELENGRLIQMPSPRREHQRVVAKLFNYLDKWCTVRQLGTVVMEVDVALPTGRGYIPDIAFVRREREAELLAEDGKIHGAPDLVVEVLSEGSRSRDLFRKFEGYQEAGVRYYWIVDPEAWLIAEYALTEQGYVLRSVTEEGEVFRPSLFEGLEIDLKAIMTTTQRP
ncbi:MAG: Uma2 family endonuclease [Firmicutes bacterium]|nr:Uma2 family endonuclease [Bacillota bacterium]